MQIIGFPRHLSQHAGGFVITRDRLSSVVSIENAAMEDRTVVKWDKDNLECLGILKVDVLALGHVELHPQGVRVSRKAFTDFAAKAMASLELRAAENVYVMICLADTIAVYQIESRAQMSMLPRHAAAQLLRPGDRCGDYAARRS